MAKRGLAFYFVMSIGINIFGGMFYLHFKYSPPIEENSMEEYYKKLEKKDVLLSEKQIRFQSERIKSKEVPFSDSDSEGYM